MLTKTMKDQCFGNNPQSLFRLIGNKIVSYPKVIAVIFYMNNPLEKWPRKTAFIKRYAT